MHKLISYFCIFFPPFCYFLWKKRAIVVALIFWIIVYNLHVTIHFVRYVKWLVGLLQCSHKDVFKISALKEFIGLDCVCRPIKIWKEKFCMNLQLHIQHFSVVRTFVLLGPIYPMYSCSLFYILASTFPLCSFVTRFISVWKSLKHNNHVPSGPIPTEWNTCFLLITPLRRQITAYITCEECTCYDIELHI